MQIYEFDMSEKEAAYRDHGCVEHTKLLFLDVCVNPS